MVCPRCRHCKCPLPCTKFWCFVRNSAPNHFLGQWLAFPLVPRVISNNAHKNTVTGGGLLRELLPVVLALLTALLAARALLRSGDADCQAVSSECSSWFVWDRCDPPKAGVGVIFNRLEQWCWVKQGTSPPQQISSNSARCLTERCRVLTLWVLSNGRVRSYF